MSEYRKLIERELPQILNMFVALPEDLYDVTSYACIYAFCKGINMSHGYRTPNHQLQELPRMLTESELESFESISYNFVQLGYKVGKQYRENQDKRRPTIVDISDAAEFVAERLGCNKYCWEAMTQAMWFPKIDRES